MSRRSRRQGDLPFGGLGSRQELAAMQEFVAKLERARHQGPQAMQRLAAEYDLGTPPSDDYMEAKQRMAARRGSNAVNTPSTDSDAYFDGLETDSEFKVCAICKVPLNRITAFDDSDEEWVHSRTWQDYDHEPVPVVVPRSEVNTQCDFCGVYAKLNWAFHGDNIQLPDPRDDGLIHDYGTVWSACDGCDPLVQAGDIDGLFDRLIEHSPLLRSAPGNWRQKREAAQHNTIIWHLFLPTVDKRVYIGPRREPAKLNPRMMPKLRNGLLKFWGEPADTLHQQWSLPYGTGALAMAFPGVHTGDEDTFLVRYVKGQEIPENVWKNHTAHIRAGIGVSEMYWVSEKYTTLAILAGKDFTEDPVLTLDALPAKFGFMLFETPIGELSRANGIADIRGFSWTIVPNGIWINLYFQGEDADPYVDVEQMRAEMGYLVCPNAGSGFAFDAPIPLSDDPRYQFMRTILATFFFLRQPGVAEVRDAPVDKKFVRAYRREHHRDPDPVRLITLRQAPRSQAGGSRAGRPLEFRQYRKGHWKMQAYGPKRGQRKHIYISPYVTGTDDMPWRPAQETVRVLR